ncbi:ABC transporter permease subunit [Neobacillus sp. MER 74]|uniref:ABC transporter permease subunit n=1 Tax=unclassified Neobacillus TaxID=2675272 RepID=UPI00203BD0D2|nr:ABC transporter permease subunit [Neobacillus sp. MER 74]MCM3116790.1 ABC transporter permease subunit [Neobacillus sp. MER 74]
MKRFFRGLVRIVLIIGGFLFIFNLPSLLGIGKDHIEVNFESFWVNLKSDFQLLLQANQDKYIEILKKLHIAESYQYTMTILLCSLLFIIFLAMISALLIFLSPEKVKNKLKNGLNFFEGIPDLLIILLFQFFVITLYKSTGLKFLQLYGLFGHKPYFVPIMTVSFLPFFLLLQFLIKIIDEEQEQQYVLYAKAKGMDRVWTLLVHMLRNIFPLLILQLRTIVWILLSNIYLVEILFNISGFNQQLFKIIFMDGEFFILVMCLLMLSIPLVIIETAGWFISKLIKGKGAVSI